MCEAMYLSIMIYTVFSNKQTNKQRKAQGFQNCYCERGMQTFLGLRIEMMMYVARISKKDLL